MADVSVRERETVKLPAAEGRNARPRARRWRRTDALLAALFILPSALLLGVFGFFPLLYAFYVSLHRWTLIKGTFVGFGNYAQAFTDDSFWQSLQVTLYYVL